MDKLLQEVLEETQQLYEAGLTANYARYEALVEMRQKLVNQMTAQGTLSDEQQRIVREIMTYDLFITSNMQQIKEEASEALLRIKNYKKQKNAYDNNSSIEGFMFDQRE
ncbi:hypothetical protein [Cohnella sp. AR92]|uniref:hypothetical protein n=1 Tax=Cohnella sp. AR92 TaxID=648716 RepID=UPI000F8CD96F|nr:hypothetical protein [Cohnella sp. AR92]RUS43048.1 hypothetical protein ELR57_25415 [Cohnella sp. AR92]